MVTTTTVAVLIIKKLFVRMTTRHCFCRLVLELLSRWNIPCNSERSALVRSTFNFTVPYLSTLAILLLLAGSVVLYLVSVRYLIMAWGVNKCARKLIRPHTVPNNEVLDLLSRVPDDEDLVCTTFISEETNSPENWTKLPCCNLHDIRTVLFAPFIVCKLWCCLSCLF
jgi:hypothetical protein